MAFASSAPEFSGAIVSSTAEYAMMFLDPDGVIRSWNPAAARVFGYPASDAVGQHHAMLYRPADCDAGVPQSELRTAEGAGHASDHRWMIRKGGEEFWAEGETCAVRDENGVLSGFARVVRNASERRRLEQAIERSNDELQRFAFAISHDLKGPLRSVRSFAELLERRYKSQLDADADEFITFILDGTKRMEDLLNDILAYSQAGREDKTRPEPTQAANVLQWAIMNVDGMAKKSGASITWDPLPTVYVDQTQMASLLQHLLSNSIKFRGAESPRIHISARRLEGDLHEFSVSDNGAGVAPEYTERIFGIFKRLVTSEVPGTGIGLAICRKIVEAHGGKIWMESEPGSGATVKFTLPAYD